MGTLVRPGGKLSVVSEQDVTNESEGSKETGETEERVVAAAKRGVGLISTLSSNDRVAVSSKCTSGARIMRWVSVM